MEISSKSNPIYKEIKYIINNPKKELFYIEGIKLLKEALNSSIKVNEIYIDKDNLHILDNLNLKDENIKITFLKNELISSLYTTTDPPTKNELLIAIAKPPDHKSAELLSSNKDLIYIENIQDPGNLGSIIRTAFAFDCGGLIISKDSANPYNPKVIRASAGGIFKIPFLHQDFDNELKNKLFENKYKIISTNQHSDMSLDELNVNNKHIFIFGNEGKGIKDCTLNHSDMEISIPQSKNIESLNVSICAGIILYSLYEKRRAN